MHITTWITRYSLLLPAVCYIAMAPINASSETVALSVNDDQVTVWNRFVESLVDLHKQGIAGREIRKSELTGGYGGEFAKGYTYREVNYHDAESGRLLSCIRQDENKPEKIQVIDVYIYDATGRVIRDYTAIYLPGARHAPIRTFINLHQYGEKLHGFRQFDASGNLLYEQCRGQFAGHDVDLSLEEHQIKPTVTASNDYQACFGRLPDTAEKYLIPN
ncbi:MAG: hypothetical protein NUV51_03080 [Sulfuricaulis sp.]|nr:hypothetical protein [Sulfuricaulis sp.]